MRYSVATLSAPPASQLPPVNAAREPALDTLVVVGNGMVGHRFCRRLVELGATERYRIVVFGEEPQPAYDRVRLTELFTGRTEDDLLLAPARWYEDHGVELRVGDPVVEIDRQSRIVRSASGTEVLYDRLALATGSSSYVPPIEGANLSGIFVYRTIRDVQAIQAQAAHARSAAVIGGGLLGLEAARALQGMGLQTAVIEAAAGVMPAQLDQRAGKELEQQIAALGIEIRTATRTSRIAAAGSRRTLYFAAGGSLTVDIVVIAAGIRPRTDLAARSDLARSRHGGVIVDDALQTSDPHIYAIGECASHRSQIYGLVAPGYEMADVLARNLTGVRATFRGSTPATRLKLLGVDVATAGEPLDRGVAIRFRADGIYRLIRIDRGYLAGALGVGEWPEFSRIQDATARRIRIRPWQLARFDRTGALWRASQDLPVTDWHPQAVVCNCLNVTRGQIAAACAQRAITVEALVERTGASTLCASCRPLLAQLVSVMASLLTLRKRWRVVSSAGAFPTWRVIHALLGALTIMILAVHTGARLGDNLNFFLMTTFIALNVLGGIAGAATAVEQRLGARAGRRWRAALVSAHVLAIWPLPMLVVFHVMAVYYF